MQTSTAETLPAPAAVDDTIEPALTEELRKLVGNGPAEVLEAYARILAEGERPVEVQLIEIIDQVREKGAGPVLALASRPTDLIKLEIEVGRAVRDKLVIFRGADFDNPQTLRNVRRAVARYLAVRFPGETPEVIAALTTEHTTIGGSLSCRTSEIVAVLWGRGRR